MEDYSKPIYQRNIFIILALVIFWPVGLFLMWKYAPWKKLVKSLLTFFFLLGALPILFIWTFVFGLKGYSFVNNILHPRTVNQSQLYTCAPINLEWSRCRNTKYNFSFEYPADWNYIDLRPKGIGFSPSNKNLKANKNLKDDFIISFSHRSDWKSEKKAKEFAKGYFETSQRQETRIGGLYATKDYKTLSDGELNLVAVIVDGKTTYQFMSHFYKLKEKGVSSSNEELQSIFDHMVNSFSIGQ